MASLLKNTSSGPGDGCVSPTVGVWGSSGSVLSGMGALGVGKGGLLVLVLVVVKVLVLVLGPRS